MWGDTAQWIGLKVVLLTNILKNKFKRFNYVYNIAKIIYLLMQPVRIKTHHSIVNL